MSQLPGGYLAERFGGKYLFTFVGLSTGALSLLIPVVASWSPYALLTVRALQGLCQVRPFSDIFTIGLYLYIF